MKSKEIKITPPEGFEIDKENSTFNCIKFKPIKKERWRDKEAIITGYYIAADSSLEKITINNTCYNLENNPYEN